MDAAAFAKARVNLREATVLCADDSDQGLEILSQMLIGFGVQRILRATTAETFGEILSAQTIDLVLVNASIGDNEGFELVRWLRRSGLEPNRFAPAIVLSGYTVRSQVVQARDCGANFVISKPVSPTVLLDRIIWAGRNRRLFVECPTYAGPDRRFKNEGVPEGMEGRRSTDLAQQLGLARDPNMSQNDIDHLLKPQKISL